MNGIGIGKRLWELTVGLGFVGSGLFRASARYGGVVTVGWDELYGVRSTYLRTERATSWGIGTCAPTLLSLWGVPRYCDRVYIL
jgi:hypothetical protein